MFKPKFTITFKILNNLTKTAAAKAVIDNAYIKVALRRQALILNAHASTAIEGNPLSLEEVSELAKGRDIMATRKAKDKALNYLKVLESLPRLVLVLINFLKRYIIKKMDRKGELRILEISVDRSALRARSNRH